MYSNETLRKIVKLLNDLIAYYMQLSPDKIKISISNGNKKIGKVLNVSLAPIITCPFCSECCRLCYDIAACLRYKNVRDARARNTVLALYYPDEFFNRIKDKMRRTRKCRHFRFQVGGDIPSMDYFARIVDVAREFPDWTIWLYTKNYSVVNTWIREHGNLPCNLTVMMSEWDGMRLDNPFNLPVFSCRLKRGNKNHSDDYFNGLHRCPGNCDVCIKGKCGCPHGQTSYVDEH